MARVDLAVPPALPKSPELLPMKPLSALLSLALLLSLAAATRADVLTGRVLNPQGQGVVGLDIDVKDAFGGDDPFVSGDFTVAGGEFMIILPSGTFDVVFRPTPDTKLFTEEIESVVVAGGIVDLGTITLRRAITLSGQVQGPGGAGLAGVNIDVVDGETNENLPITNDLTPAGGAFSIIAPEGLLEVQFEAPVTGPVLASAALELTALSNANLGTITLEPGFRLTANLRGPGNTPIVNADTDVRDAVTDDKIFTPGDNSGVDGCVSVVVPAGSYVFVSQPFFGDGLAALSVATGNVNSDTDLGTLNHVAGVLLSGTITGDGVPLAGIDVDLRDPADDSDVPLGPDNSDADGNYAIFVPPGTWDVIYAPVEGEPFAPVRFEDVVLTDDTVFDVDLFACPAPCAGPPPGSLLPPLGPPEGGNVVTLLGTEFVDDGSTTVTFGGQTATIVSITPPSSMEVLAPAGAADSTVMVSVDSSAGTTEIEDPYTYGDLTLEAGNRLDGSLPPADVDRVFFEAVAGSKLNATFKAAKGSTLLPGLRVMGPDGVELLSLEESAGKPNASKAKKLDLGLTGLYILELTARDGSSGDYQLITKVKPPKKAKEDVSLEAGATTVTIPFGGRDGWTLKKVNVSSKKAKTVPLGPFMPQLELVDPDGKVVDVSETLKVNKSGTGVSFSNVPMTGFGTWLLRISGVDMGTGQAKVTIARKAAKVPKATIIEP